MSGQIYRWLPGDELKPLRTLYNALVRHLSEQCEYCTFYAQYACLISEHKDKYHFIEHIEEVTKEYYNAEKSLKELHKRSVVQYDVVTEKMYSLWFLKMKQ